MQVVRHWNRLPIEAMDAPYLNAFRAGLDGPLGSLWEMSLPMTGRLEPDDLECPFQTKQFYDCMTIMTFKDNF